MPSSALLGEQGSLPSFSNLSASLQCELNNSSPLIVLFLLLFVNILCSPVLIVGCAKIWRRKKKDGKEKEKPRQVVAIPGTPHPPYKSDEHLKHDVTPLCNKTITPETFSAGDQNKKKGVVPLRPTDDLNTARQEELVITTTGETQPNQQATKENSLEKGNEKIKIVASKQQKKGPTKDVRKIQSVPCKTGKEADNVVDTSVQRMSPENTLRDVPRSMPELKLNYGPADVDRTFTNAQLL